MFAFFDSWSTESFSKRLVGNLIFTFLIVWSTLFPFLHIIFLLISCFANRKILYTNWRLKGAITDTREFSTDVLPQSSECVQLIDGSNFIVFYWFFFRAESLTSAYNMVRNGLCPYFYLCTHQFNVLWRAANIAGKSQVHAFLSPTTRGLRQALAKEGIFGDRFCIHFFRMFFNSCQRRSQNSFEGFYYHL